MRHLITIQLYARYQEKESDNTKLFSFDPIYYRTCLKWCVKCENVVGTRKSIRIKK